MQGRALIIDTETRGLRPELGETAFAAASAWLDAPKQVTLYRLDQTDDRAALLYDLARAGTIIGHHLVFDLRQLVRTFDLDERFFDGHTLHDTRIRASYAWPARYFQKFRSGARPFALKSLTADAQGIPGDEKALKSYLTQRCIEKYGKSRAKWSPFMRAELTDYSLVPDEILAPYLIGDIVRTHLLWERCAFHLKMASAGTLRSLELDESLLKPILAMELRGLPISLTELETQVEAQKNQLRHLRDDLGWDYSKRAQLEQRWGDMAEHFGFFTNRNDPKTGLRRHRFDVNALKRFAREGAPEAEKVLKARNCEKRIATYGKAWDPWARRVGKLHCYLNVEGTHTGRFSCNGPNLQNIPREKGGLRRCLVPEPGHAMICADWASMEYVAAAHIAQDPVLLEDVLTGDIHARTATQLFGTLAPEKTEKYKIQRASGKTFNYAAVYGATEFKLKSQLEKDTGEAWPVKRLGAAFDYLRSRYANLNAWRMQVMTLAEKGVVQTDPWGRRYIPQRRRAFAMVNWLIQGFCAGVMKRVALRMHEHGLDLRMLIHDEALVMVPLADVPRMVGIVEGFMRNVEGYVFPVEALVALDCYANKRPLAELNLEVMK